MDLNSADDFTPSGIEELLAHFKDKLDEATVVAVVEEFHGDVESAFQVLLQLVSARG